MLYFLQQLLNGLHSGALYALLAFGYAVTNAVLHRTNLAYGALFAFAGQTMILAAVFGWQVLWLTLPATLAFGALAALALTLLAGFALSRSVLEKLAPRAPDAIVVATLGLSIFLMELSRIAAETRDFWLPPLLATPVVLVAAGGFSVTLTVLQLVNCAVAVAAVAVATIFLWRSRFGRQWRAVSDDPGGAALCGVDTRRVFRRAVLFGALTATIAGMLAGLYYGNISFGTGLFFGLKILFVTAVGGYRDPLRAAFGAACFGIGESLWSGYFPVEWRDAWMFLFLVALLVLRPSGEERSRPA